jgi:regulator of sigma E protease
MAIVAFSVLIIVHELGHFTLAKLNKVYVEEFSLGMGPKVVSFQGKETKYSLRLFPIGGFVKMLGDDQKSNDPRAFNNKHPLRKLSIVAAGPIMNIILAVIFFGLSSYQGIKIPTISKVEPGYPAENKIIIGDEITKLNDKRVSEWDDILVAMSTNKGEVIKVTVKRNNTELPLDITPKFVKEEKRYVIGIDGTIKYPSLNEAVKYGFNESIFMIKMTGSFLNQAVHGKASADDVGGPISVGKITLQAAKAGIYPLLFIAAYISLQLGLFNIIPFPALDGGYIFLFIYQAVTRKEIDDNKVGFVNYIGFILLMTLMVIVIIKDIVHPIQF